MALLRANDPSAIRQTGDELTDLQTVRRLIDVVVEEIVAGTPLRQRALVPNALLSLAVERMLAEESASSGAPLLYRLAELISGGANPHGSVAFPLNGHDA